jgi:hypothetical protein
LYIGAVPNQRPHCGVTRSGCRQIRRRRLVLVCIQSKAPDARRTIWRCSGQYGHGEAVTSSGDRTVDNNAASMIKETTCSVSQHHAQMEASKPCTINKQSEKQARRLFILVTKLYLRSTTCLQSITDAPGVTKSCTCSCINYAPARPPTPAAHKPSIDPMATG